MINKERAIELRTAGLSYADIAKELGCSEIWCKTNLKGVVKNSAEKEAITRCAKQGCTKEAVTYGDIAQEINKTLGIYQHTNKEGFDRAMKRFKAGIAKVPGAIVRPYWMCPTESKEVLDNIISEINDLDLRMWEGIQSIKEKYNLDESYNKSLYRAIGGLLYCNHNGQDGSLADRLNYLGDIAEELHKRNTSVST